jgi:predicted dehydrogenase
MRTAVIGLGRMGLRHLKIVADSGADVVGVVDPRDQARDQAMAEFSLPATRCFADAATMLKTARPECVVIATTAPSHADLACRAATLGVRYILCEKPMAVSLAQCDAMLAACAESGAKLAINHQMRFMEQYTRSKTIIESDAFGGLGSATVIAGNFGLAMNGTHYFEAFRYITGEPVTTVSARFSAETVPNPRGAQFVDRAGTVRLETASGKRFYLDASADQGHGMIAIYAGRHGRLTIDELTGRAHLVMRRPEHRAMSTIRYGMPWEEEEFSIAPADAVEPSRAVFTALLAGEDFPNATIARQAVEVLVACYRSDEQDGRIVHLDRDQLPRDRVFPWA